MLQYRYCCWYRYFIILVVLVIVLILLAVYFYKKFQHMKVKKPLEAFERGPINEFEHTSIKSTSTGTSPRPTFARPDYRALSNIFREQHAMQPVPDSTTTDTSQITNPQSKLVRVFECSLYFN